MTWYVTVNAKLVNRADHEILAEYVVNIKVAGVMSRASAISQACARVRDDMRGNRATFVRASGASAVIIGR